MSLDNAYNRVPKHTVSSTGMGMPTTRERDPQLQKLEGDVFSKMNHILREKNSTLKDKIKDVNYQIDIMKNKNLVDDYELEYVSIKELCKSADIISIHLPLNTETHHLIDKTLIELMKPNAIIINTARGAVINTKDVIDALVNEKISGLAMDVYEHERDLFFND